MKLILVQLQVLHVLLNVAVFNDVVRYSRCNMIANALFIICKCIIHEGLCRSIVSARSCLVVLFRCHILSVHIMLMCII